MSRLTLGMSLKSGETVELATYLYDLYILHICTFIGSMRTLTIGTMITLRSRRRTDEFSEPLCSVCLFIVRGRREVIDQVANHDIVIFA